SVERVSGQPHDLAGLRDVAQLLRQIQQPQFVPNDACVTMFHCRVTFLRCFDRRLAPLSKRVTLPFASSSVRSDRNYYSLSRLPPASKLTLSRSSRGHVNSPCFSWRSWRAWRFSL